jgi:tetratricopeptide (TPR) repeat protein
MAIDECRTAMMLAMDQSPDLVRAVTGDLRRMLPERSDVEQVVPLFERPPSPSLARANDRLLTRIYRRIDRGKDAAVVLDRLIQSAKDDFERANLWQEKGEVHHLAGEFDAARAAYEQSLRHDPENWVTLNNLAYLLSDQMGENQAALAYAQKAVATVENPSALDTLGWIYVGLGEYSAAIAELGRAVRLDPNSALIYYHLGEAYRRNGQMAEAADVLQGARNIARAAGDQAQLELIERSLERTDARDAGA